MAITLQYRDYTPYTDVEQGRIQGATGAIAPLKLMKVTFFTMIFYNPERHLTAN